MKTNNSPKPKPEVIKQVEPVAAQLSIGDFSQDELVQVLVKVAPRRWIEREDLLRLAVAKLGFSRIGPKIRQRFKSAFTGAIRRGYFEYQDTRVRRL